MTSTSSEYPHPTSPAATAVMRANKKRDTQPEVRLRSLLHGRGMRFRKDYMIRVNDRRVRVDIAFPVRRVAVFVDGCFWHRCPDHGNIPRANNRYWGPKLERNVERDRQQSMDLEADGWRVIRIWEHVCVEEAAQQIIDCLTAAR